MRRILIESARRKSRIKRGGGGQVKINLEDLNLAADEVDDSLLLIDEAVEQLKKSDPEKAGIVVMKFFGGMTNQEIGEHLGVTERTVERHWAYARAWLLRAVTKEI